LKKALASTTGHIFILFILESKVMTNGIAGGMHCPDKELAPAAPDAALKM